MNLYIRWGTPASGTAGGIHKPRIRQQMAISRAVCWILVLIVRAFIVMERVSDCVLKPKPAACKFKVAGWVKIWAALLRYA
jgi:hypothetical protein